MTRASAKHNDGQVSGCRAVGGWVGGGVSSVGLSTRTSSLKPPCGHDPAAPNFIRPSAAINACCGLAECASQPPATRPPADAHTHTHTHTRLLPTHSHTHTRPST